MKGPKIIVTLPKKALNAMKNQLRISLLQCDLQWKDPKANFLKIEQMARTIDQSDLVVLPEMFATGFIMDPEQSALAQKEALDFMHELAKKTGAVVCGSLAVEDSGDYYNRFYAINASEIIAVYDKKHLFALAGEHHRYKAGVHSLTFEVNGFRIRPIICYDLRFPVWCRLELPYDLLLCVANWPAPRINAWDTLLVARAIENQCFSLGVNRVGLDPNSNSYPGHSAVYDGFGKQLCFSQEEEALSVVLGLSKVQKLRESLPYLSDRDDFTLKF